MMCAPEGDTMLLVRGGKPNPGTPKDGRLGNKNAGPKKGSKKKKRRR